MTGKVLDRIVPFTDEPIRFIDQEGKPLFEFHPEDLGLSEEDLKRMFYYMKLTRRFDEKGMILTRSGKARFYVEVAGQEASTVASAYALDENDWIYPAHREHGVYIVRGYPLVDMFAQLMGRVEPNKARQMPVHWGLRRLRIITISSPVGNQLPQVPGIGYAIKYMGRKEAVIGYVGDGGTAEGDFHVGLTFAGVFRTPTVFFVQNNHWAISVPLERQFASKNIAIKAVAYGMDGYYVDGNDFLAVYTTTKMAMDRARENSEPSLIESLTYRYGAHSTADDANRYRDPKEVEYWKSTWDPIKRARGYLKHLGIWSKEWEDELDERIENELDQAIEEADRRPIPGPETVFEDVFADMPWHLREQYEELMKELEEREGR